VHPAREHSLSTASAEQSLATPWHVAQLAEQLAVMHDWKSAYSCWALCVAASSQAGTPPSVNAAVATQSANVPQLVSLAHVFAAVQHDVCKQSLHVGLTTLRPQPTTPPPLDPLDPPEPVPPELLDPPDPPGPLPPLDPLEPLPGSPPPEPVLLPDEHPAQTNPRHRIIHDPHADELIRTIDCPFWSENVSEPVSRDP
jgi:hypothetical protein